jgi:urease accessory protein UreF
MSFSLLSSRTAHSRPAAMRTPSGLEAYCHAGIIRNRHDLEQFLVTQLDGATGSFDATAALAALPLLSLRKL